MCKSAKIAVGNSADRPLHLDLFLTLTFLKHKDNRIIMRFLLIIMTALCAAFGVAAQSDKVDSLKRELGKKVHDTTQVNILNDLSYELSELDTVQARKYAQQALAKAQKSNYYKGMAEANYNIAYVYTLLYQKNVASAYYQKGIEISKKHSIQKTLALGYQDYAILLKSDGKFKEALSKNLEAVKIYEALRDSAHLVLIYTNTGNCYSNLKLSELAIAYHIKSLKISQQRNNNAGIARTYNNIGIVYERNGSFEKAHENYLKALQPAIASGKKNLIAGSNGNIGSSFVNLKQPQKALPYIKTAIKQEEALGNKVRIGLNLNNIAAVYNDLQQYQNALDASIRGMEVAKEADDQESLAYAHLTAATAAAGLKKYQAAKVYMDTAYSQAKALNISALLLAVYEQSARLYKNSGDFKTANGFNELLGSLKDSTYNAEKHAQIAALQEQYDSQRKDKLLTESELAAAKNKIQIAGKNRMLLISAIVVVSLIFLILLVVRNMKLQRARLQSEKALAASAAEQELLNEKLRISGELHDNIGSQLTFIHSSLQNLRTKNGATGESATGESVTGEDVLQETESLAADTIRDLRQTVWFINNSSFTLEDFILRIREFIKPSQASNPGVISISSDAPGDLVLSAAKATHLFRIVQEAVNNSIKYAGASAIAIDILKGEGDKLVVKITDNGRGFDEATKGSGFGLRSMQARAKQSGGDFEVQSAVNKGTSIAVSIPV
ncbi:MAG: tetratricopeptide repeat protein [Pedobacter sp.]|nr:MAG: tetratricopeptide repeat protein [Pedobacter sp.]